MWPEVHPIMKIGAVITAVTLVAALAVLALGLLGLVALQPILILLLGAALGFIVFIVGYCLDIMS